MAAPVRAVALVVLSRSGRLAARVTVGGFFFLKIVATCGVTGGVSEKV